MTVSSAPIGNTGQSLDGFVAPVNFRESVVITDPNDQFGISTVVSTQPITGYAIPVWIQGTPNFSSTVNVTSIVNVSTSLSGSISSFAVNSLPGTTMVNVVSTVPQSITIGTVSSFPLGTTNVNIVSSIALGFTPTGTSFVSISSSQPIIVAQSTVPWQISGTSSVNIISSVALGFTPTGTSMVNIVSSIPLGGGVQYVNNSVTTQATGNMNMWAFGPGNSTVVSVSSSQPLPTFQVSSVPLVISGTTFVNVVSTVTQQVNITSSITQGVNVFPVSTGGLIPFIKIGVTTASVQIKSGAGKVHDIAFTNNATSTRWLKFYNASSAAVGTTAPFMVFGMPGNTTGAQPIAGWIASAMGYGFSTNIFVAATASSATSTDTSAPASADIVLNVGYI